ncbi:hypothetical protein PaG_06001 [Moesziomyces aphidis]|uniref:Mediator of RNA polymerase II transcription subunit 8 n=1 Tax=Moesziomyces aphidis TaxID=84754 RepID=W3VEQ4_MOEAP|nr:hypothetical protein PaG_06001 [Moesziomyces aphidis]
MPEFRGNCHHTRIDLDNTRPLSIPTIPRAATKIDRLEARITMSSKRSNDVAAAVGHATLGKVQMPAEHLQILQQRFESLLSSIVGLKEEIATVPGVDEWPALLHRYTNLLSHAYSLSSSLLSASPHFLPSQLASFNKVLEAEAENSNLYADVGTSSALFGSLMADGLPELSFYDRNNPLPLLLAHPVLPIPDENINFLGALLRTAPEADIIKQESSLVESYDAAKAQTVGRMASEDADVDAQLEQIEDEIAQHDMLALRSLRTWYHVRYAPDEEGNVLNVRERLAPADDADEDAGEEESEDDDSDDDAQTKAQQLEQRHRRKLDQDCWTADAVSAFLRGQPVRS